MTKEQIHTIIKHLIIYYLVFLAVDILLPRSEIKNIKIHENTRLFLRENFRYYLKVAIPSYISVRLFFFFRYK